MSDDKTVPDSNFHGLDRMTSFKLHMIALMHFECIVKEYFSHLTIFDQSSTCFTVFQDHEFLMTTADDEALERAIRTLRRRIAVLEREDEELTRYDKQSKFS